jgi:hypothetical protein
MQTRASKEIYGLTRGPKNMCRIPFELAAAIEHIRTLRREISGWILVEWPYYLVLLLPKIHNINEAVSLGRKFGR